MTPTKARTVMAVRKGYSLLRLIAGSGGDIAEALSESRHQSEADADPR